MDVKLVAKAQMKDLKIEVEGSMFPGEWISVTISKIAQQSEKKKFHSLNAVLKLLLFKLVPYDVSCPAPMRVEGVPFEKGEGKDTRIVVESGKGGDVKHEEGEEEKDVEEDGEVEYKGRKNSLSIGKYIVKSTAEMRGDKKIKVWKCPYEECNEKFGLSHKCGVHLNKHLNHFYQCPTCLYKSYSLDGYKHYICFKGPKTQGEQKYKKPNWVWSEKSEEGETLERGRKWLQLLQY